MIDTDKRGLALEVIQYLVIMQRKAAYDNGSKEIGDALDDVDYALGLMLQPLDKTAEFDELVMAMKKQGIEVPAQIYFKYKD